MHANHELHFLLDHGLQHLAPNLHLNEPQLSAVCTATNEENMITKASLSAREY